jgi:NDP-sugar pyrophosphorylase family protein
VSGERITAFEKLGRAEPALRHFPGFYVIEKTAVARLPKAGKSFGIVEELWRPLAAEGKLGAWEYTGPYLDLGTVADLEAAERVLAKS